MAASYKARGNSFVAEKPRVRFKKGIPNIPSDLAPDGKSIVALMPADTSEEPHDRLTLLLNFFDELRRRVSSGAN
jgi:serine/threonine-protein kinase